MQKERAPSAASNISQYLDHYQKKMTKEAFYSNLTEVGLGIWVQPLPLIQIRIILLGGSRSRVFLGLDFGASSSSPGSDLGFAGSSFLGSSLGLGLADSFGWDASL